MTKNMALFSWLNQFLPFYRSTVSDPGEDTTREFPYGTYEYVADAWRGDVSLGTTSTTLSLWYRTESEAEPDAKAQEISEAIGLGGALIPCDDGYIWIQRGSPFVQSLTDPDDIAIKRRLININISFLVKD